MEDENHNNIKSDFASCMASFYCLMVWCSGVHTYFPSAAPVMSCDWLVEGQQLVTASWDHTAKLWDFESGQVIHSLEGESTTSWFLLLITRQAIFSTSILISSFLSSVPFHLSILSIVLLSLLSSPPYYHCSLFLSFPLSVLICRPWPRAHSCLYAPYTATDGHFLTRHHLQASVSWCRCTVVLSV